MATKKQKKSKRKKTAKKQFKFANVYIYASFNNTLITVTDREGNAVGWGSSGSVGFKGTRKSTPFAATMAVEKVIGQVKENYGIDEVEIYVRGPGPGRDASLRAIRSAGLKINQIADVTPMPHNGPRPKKRRRV